MKETAMEEMQQLRSKATELLLREEWAESINAYSQLISLCQHQPTKTHEKYDQESTSKVHKSLCLALSNRAEARYRLREFSRAMQDCDQALQIESTHFKALVCKGKILLHLNRYSNASDCFRNALDHQISGRSEILQGLLDRCKKLEFQSRTGCFDLSDWILNGFQGKSPELAEYLGPVQIKRSETGGRGLFATKNVEAGTLFLVTKAVAIGRAILPESDEDSSEDAKLGMWRDFVDKIRNAAAKCSKTLHLIYTLSTGEDEEGKLEALDINLFRSEIDESIFGKEKLDMGRILKILDLNALAEDSFSGKILGKNSNYYGVGLWILPSFVNHSCNPNTRRLHIGDYVAIHASRDVKAGEEITFGYFDVLLPLKKRRQMSKEWGFYCNCTRCRFEEICNTEELREIERVGRSGSDNGEVAVRLEEGMKSWSVKGREKGLLRASFWDAYSGVFKSEKLMRRWGKRIPAATVVAESVVAAVGGDERIMKVVLEGLKRGDGLVEIERAIKLGRGVYGKVMKKQALRALFESGFH